MGHIERLDRRNAPLLEAMVGLFQQGQEPHYAAFPDHFGPAEDPVAITQYFHGFLKPRNPWRKRSGFAYGWFEDGRLSGYLLYYLHQGQNIFYGKPRWTCFIEDIVVGKEKRGMGGASSLMTALLDEMAELENCAISGTVWSGNSSSDALFQKHGFEPLTTGFYKVLR